MIDIPVMNSIATSPIRRASTLELCSSVRACCSRPRWTSRCGAPRTASRETAASPWSDTSTSKPGSDGNGFFLLPVDEDANNRKVFVIASSVADVTVVP